MKSSICEGNTLSVHCFLWKNQVYLIIRNQMIAENVQNIRQRISSACKKVGRNADEITLVAVTKTFSSETIRQALEAGVADIGESYVQEMVQKHEKLKGEGIKWHFIGHLQTNKVKYIAEWVHLIHAVDSIKLGNEISKWAAKYKRRMDVLIEVKTSGQSTHFGVPIENANMFVKELSKLPNINVCGLMTIGPFLPDPEESRGSFRMLRQLRDSIENEGYKLPILSMGMTNDFEVAIEEGATMVRIGTAIFGSRKIRNQQDENDSI